MCRDAEGPVQCVGTPRPRAVCGVRGVMNAVKVLDRAYTYTTACITSTNKIKTFHWKERANNTTPQLLCTVVQYLQHMTCQYKALHSLACTDSLSFGRICSTLKQFWHD